MEKSKVDFIDSKEGDVIKIKNTKVVLRAIGSLGWIISIILFLMSYVIIGSEIEGYDEIGMALAQHFQSIWWTLLSVALFLSGTMIFLKSFDLPDSP